MACSSVLAFSGKEKLFVGGALSRGIPPHHEFGRLNEGSTEKERRGQKAKGVFVCGSGEREIERVCGDNGGVGWWCRAGTTPTCCAAVRSSAKQVARFFAHWPSCIAAAWSVTVGTADLADVTILLPG